MEVWQDIKSLNISISDFADLFDSTRAYVLFRKYVTFIFLHTQDALLCFLDK